MHEDMWPVFLLDPYVDSILTFVNSNRTSELPVDV